MQDPSSSDSSQAEDIQVLKKKIIELEQVKQELKEKLASLGKEVSTFTHDINNPLAIIIGRIDQLEMFAENGDVAQQNLMSTTKKMRETASRITKIIHDIRESARDHDTPT